MSAAVCILAAGKGKRMMSDQPKVLHRIAGKPLLGHVLAAIPRATADAVAVVIGLILGGSQALSRSMFSQMIPAGQEAEYYSIYEVGERGTSWIGPLLFGLTLQFTGSYRQAILSLIVFFAVGLVLLSRIDLRRAAREAGNEPPSLV